MTETGETVYFLGAGATRADFATAPLGADLLHAILSTDPSSNAVRAFLESLFDASSVASDAKQEARPRLDDVLTLIDTCLSGRTPLPTALSLEELSHGKRLLVAAIGRILDATLKGSRGLVALRFAQVLRDDPQPVISTNYDIVLDNALVECESVNYGVAVRAAVGRRGAMPEVRPDELIYFVSDPGSSSLVRRGDVPLLKLNGSLNWLYCPRCDELDITVMDKGALHILDSPKMGRCGNAGCTGRYEPLLVGPSLEQRYENRILRDTWSRAEKALSAAEHLVVIGYSLPEADYLIRAMLARHFATRSQRVCVVSTPESSAHDAALTVRYRRLFPRCDFRWDGFSGIVDSLVRDGC